MDAFSYEILSFLKQKPILGETTRRAFETRYLLSAADSSCGSCSSRRASKA